MSRSIVIALLLFLSASPALATPPATPTLRQKVGVLLAQRHGLAAKERFLALGPEARQLLLELAADPKLFPLHRSRALAALSYFPGPDVELVIRSVLESETTLPSVRRAAIEVYARSYPATAGAVLAPLVSSTDADLGEVVERALNRPDVAAPQR